VPWIKTVNGTRRAALNLFPDQALSRHVRGKMVSELRQAYEQGELNRITHPGEVDALLDRLMALDWVVYTKPWLKKP